MTRQERVRAGWTPPGPVPPGDRGEPDLLPGPGETLDAFAGHWRIFQLADGHRYSTDDLLAAWYACDVLTAMAAGHKLTVAPAIADQTGAKLTEAPSRTGGGPTRFLDLGTGIGSVAFFLLWRFPRLRAVGIDAQRESLALAARTARYNGVADRFELRHGDLREPCDLGRFSLITGSPPYWAPGNGVVSDRPQKGPCRFELRGGVEAYFERAAAHLAPTGRFVLVYDGRQQERLLSAAAAADLAPCRLRPVIAREGDRPLLVLGEFGSGQPRLEPPLLLRQRDGHRSPEFSALREAMGLPPGP